MTEYVKREAIESFAEYLQKRRGLTLRQAAGYLDTIFLATKGGVREEAEEFSAALKLECGDGTQCALVAAYDQASGVIKFDDAQKSRIPFAEDAEAMERLTEAIRMMYPEQAFVAEKEDILKFGISVGKMRDLLLDFASLLENQAPQKARSSNGLVRLSQKSDTRPLTQDRVQRVANAFERDVTYTCDSIAYRLNFLNTVDLNTVDKEMNVIKPDVDSERAILIKIAATLTSGMNKCIISENKAASRPAR